MPKHITAAEKASYTEAKQRREDIETEVVEGRRDYTQKRFSNEEILAIIPGTGGIIATIAARLGVGWETAKRYTQNIEVVRIAYEAECETVSDRAESVVIASINKGHVGNAKWWLSRKRRDKFSTKQEVVYSGDIDLRRLSDAELEAIIQTEGES